MALLSCSAHSQEHTPFENRHNGAGGGVRIERPASARDQDRVGPESEESPLRKEWNVILAAREAALRKELQQQNASDLRKLEELKVKAAQTDIELARHILDQLAAVKRSEPIEAEEPEAPARGAASLSLSSNSSNPNSLEQQLWRIKKARDETITKALQRINYAARNSFSSLQQRAIKADDFDLVEEMKATMAASTHRQENWLGSYESGNETLEFSRKGKELILHMNGRPTPAEWDPKLKVLIVHPGWWNLHLKSAPDGSKLTEINGGSPGRIWRRSAVATKKK